MREIFKEKTDWFVTKIALVLGFNWTLDINQSVTLVHEVLKLSLTGASLFIIVFEFVKRQKKTKQTLKKQ